MTGKVRWLALGYNVPINPSKNRVYIWRKLKECGAEYFKQGVAVLPYNKKNYNYFMSLLSKINNDMGGEASIIEIKFLDPADEKDMINRFKNQYVNDIAAIKNDCTKLLSELKGQAENMISDYETEQLKKMVKSFSKARSRDYFETDISDEIETSIYSIIDTIKPNKEQLKKQLKKYLESEEK